jgi:excisionase family DNA binding protein
MLEALIPRTLTATGWSKSELARRLGVHKHTVRDWLHRGRHPRARVSVDLERELRRLQAEVALVLEAMESHRIANGSNAEPK